VEALPSPKSHCHDVGPSVERSVNETGTPAHAGAVNEKSLTGTWLIVTVCVKAEDAPQLLNAISVTV
jgi:hypothetical protein